MKKNQQSKFLLTFFFTRTWTTKNKIKKKRPTERKKAVNRTKKEMCCLYFTDGLCYTYNGKKKKQNITGQCD